MNTPTRPDLSFLTKKKFKSMEEFEQYHEKCDEEKKEIIEKAVTMVPELIQIAEMFFDSQPNDSFNCQIASDVLNKIKYERPSIVEK